MNEYEIANLAASQMAARASVASAAAAAVAALGIWVFGVGMLVQNWRRAEAEKNRHTESMAAEKRRTEAEKNRHTESMTALSELIRRTSPPSSRAGPAE